MIDVFKGHVRRGRFTEVDRGGDLPGIDFERQIG